MWSLHVAVAAGKIMGIPNGSEGAANLVLQPLLDPIT